MLGSRGGKITMLIPILCLSEWLSALDWLRFESISKLGFSREPNHLIATWQHDSIAQVAAKCQGYVLVCINACREVIDDYGNE